MLFSQNILSENVPGYVDSILMKHNYVAMAQ